MSGGGSIVWLASYPRSGNTWLRVFFSNLINSEDRPADINSLSVHKHAASRSWFDSYCGVLASDLTESEIEDLRPAVYEAVANEQPAPFFVKIHDALRHTPCGQPLISHGASRAAIYIIRNPLDVAVSYAHHQDVRFETAVRQMADDDHAIAAASDGIALQLKQKLGSWSTHVKSWVDAATVRTHVVRYEDMQFCPLSTFRALADFAEVPYTATQLERAIQFSAFSGLREQEDAGGFAERSRRARRFFRRGQIGAWRDELSPSLADLIVQCHGPVMRRFGYLEPPREAP